MTVFACMQWPDPRFTKLIGDSDLVYRTPQPAPSLFQPPMKTWLEHVAEELDCRQADLCLCRSFENGIERYWWEQRASTCKLCNGTKQVPSSVICGGQGIEYLTDPCSECNKQ